ncbi:MAG: hypothetical protein WCA10_10220 [Terracidiphilus sp.]
MTEAIEANLFLEMVHQNYCGPLKTTIRAILNQKRRFLDASVDENDLYSDVLLALIRGGYADKLQQPGTTATATLKARLRAFARRHTLNHIKKTKRRHSIIEKRPHELGKFCEALTPEEMACIRAEMEEDE